MASDPTATGSQDTGSPAQLEDRRRLSGLTLEALLTDVRRGLRLLMREPFFAAGVVLLLALGIGATTAVFALVKGVLLTPLPYPDPDRLVMVWETEPDFLHVPLSGPNYFDWEERARSFERLAAVWPGWFNLADSNEPRRLAGMKVTHGIFDVLGIGPQIGRSFLIEDEQPGAPPVAILSHGLWSRQFAASPEVLGTMIELNGQPHTVVGVMPRGFDVATPWTVGRARELWTPLILPSSAAKRDSHSYMSIARLAPGVALEQAQAEMDTITAALATAFPSTNLDHGARVARLHSELVGSTTGLMLLMAAAVFVLLIVCANVGGLMVAKAAARENELAVRFSLGAGRGRLLLQLLAEHLPLAFLGGALGAVMASWALDGLRFLVPRSPAGGSDYRIDPWTLAVVTGLALCTAVAIGVAPALAASRTRLASSLNQGRGSLFTTPGRARVYRALIVVQLALTLVLANGAALMITSYLKLQRSHHGFDPGGVTAVSLHLAGPGYESAEEVLAYFSELLTRVRLLPGVETAATTSKLPLYGGTNGRVVIEGREDDWGKERGPLVERSLINPGYFRALGVPLRQGRLPAESDLGSDSPVAIINESMARLGWPDADPIGGRFALDDDHQWITIVGVVADIRQWGAEQPPLPEYFLAFGPHAAYWAGWSFRAERTYLLLKSDLPARNLLEPLKREIRAVSPEQPVSEVRSMEEVVASMTVRRRFNTLLISTFAAIGLVLVAMGVFGMMSTFVTQRQHEIGVRMALGADVRRVIGLILGYSSRLLAIGIVGGLIGLLISTRLLASLLYAVSPTDPAILVGGTALVVVVGLIGALLPALRATRVEPVAALRSEH